MCGEVIIVAKSVIVDPNLKLKEEIFIYTNNNTFIGKKEFLDYLISKGLDYIKSNDRRNKLNKI
jgi:hypothetical protein